MSIRKAIKEYLTGKPTRNVTYEIMTATYLTHQDKRYCQIRVWSKPRIPDSPGQQYDYQVIAAKNTLQDEIDKQNTPAALQTIIDHFIEYCKHLSAIEVLDNSGNGRIAYINWPE